jgi:hypothetical protein
MGLVYPVVFSDGASFPSEASRTQARMDLRDYAYPYDQFKRTKKYLGFHDRMTEVAKSLARLFEGVPPWKPEWTPVRPSPKPPPTTRFKRL